MPYRSMPRNGSVHYGTECVGILHSICKLEGNGSDLFPWAFPGMQTVVNGSAMFIGHFAICRAG
jgi:hypothetical protein